MIIKSKIHLRPPNIYGHWFGKAYISEVIGSSIDVTVYPQKIFHSMKFYIHDLDCIVGYILFDNLIFMLLIL